MLNAYSVGVGRLTNITAIIAVISFFVLIYFRCYSTAGEHNDRGDNHQCDKSTS